MRKILMVFSIATVFAACNAKKDLETSKDVVPTDTTGAYKNSLATDTATIAPTPVTPAVTVTKTAPPATAKRRQAPPKVIYLPAPETKPVTAPVTTTTTTTTTPSTTGTGTTAGTGTTTGTDAGNTT